MLIKRKAANTQTTCIWLPVSGHFANRTTRSTSYANGQ